MVLDMLPPAQAAASRVVNIGRFNFFMADKIEILGIGLLNFIDGFGYRKPNHGLLTYA